MDEKDIFEAFGINPVEGSEGGKEQEVAAPANQTEAPEGDGAASEAERSSRDGQEAATSCSFPPSLPPVGLILNASKISFSSICSP